MPVQRSRAKGQDRAQPHASGRECFRYRARLFRASTRSRMPEIPAWPRLKNRADAVLRLGLGAAAIILHAYRQLSGAGLNVDYEQDLGCHGAPHC
jgi:hypothetical protein